MNYEQLASFEPALAEFLEKMRHCFKRDKTFSYMQKYMLGLMADLKRKSIEPIALASGLACRLAMYFLADQTTRLRGKKSANNAGAGSGCCQYVSVEDMAEVPAFVETESVCV